MTDLQHAIDMAIASIRAEGYVRIRVQSESDEVSRSRTFTGEQLKELTDFLSWATAEDMNLLFRLPGTFDHEASGQTPEEER